MKQILTPQQILLHRQIREPFVTSYQFDAVDHTRPYIPEQYTQLYHTPVYTMLNRQQKLRYNQLYAVRMTEQFMFFESGFTNRVMQTLVNSHKLNSQEQLKQCLTHLLTEEEEHYQMFRALNRVCEPELYADNDFYFLRLSIVERTLLNMASRFPLQIVALIWLVLLMEEHAVRFSNDMVSYTSHSELGELEQNYVHAYRLHLKDEAGHVHIDANILDVVLGICAPAKRKLNVMLLKKLLQATLRPKHAGIHVIRRLVHEMPELLPFEQDMENAIRALDYDPCMLPLLRESKYTPITSLLLQDHPEFTAAFQI